MIRRTAAVLALTLIALALMYGAGLAAGKPNPWHSCKPQETMRWGQYRVANDEFDPHGPPSCVSSVNGHDITLHTCYQGGHGGVVAYPDVRVGDFYSSRDPLAHVLMPVARPHRLRLRLSTAVASWGRNCGRNMTLTDSDWWFYDSSTIRGHGTEELVLSNANQNFLTGCVRHLIIHHRRYCANVHLTGPAGHKWPLVVLRLVRPSHRLKVYVPAVIRKLRHLGWLPRNKWLGSVAYGTEVWSGGQGITDSMTVSYAKETAARYRAP